MNKANRIMSLIIQASSVRLIGRKTYRMGYMDGQQDSSHPIKIRLGYVLRVCPFRQLRWYIILIF